MTQPYDYDRYSDAFKRIQEPMQAFVDLNIKTVQSFQQIKPEDLSKISKPEDFLENQLEMALANGHKAMDYMQKSFQIFEKAMLSFAKEMKGVGKKQS